MLELRGGRWGDLFERHDGACATVGLEFDVVCGAIGVEERGEAFALTRRNFVLDAHTAGLEVGGQEFDGNADVAAVVHVVVVVDVVAADEDGGARCGFDLRQTHAALGVLHGVLLVVGQGVDHLLRQRLEFASGEVDECAHAVANVAGFALFVADDVVAEAEEGFALVDGGRNGEFFAELGYADDVNLA